MRLHRFYISPDKLELKNEVWIKDLALIKQWLRVLRYREGDDLVLFDGIETERLYKLSKIEEEAVRLDMVTEFKRNTPDNHMYLFFSLMKKDKNYWVIQKATELGVRNFVPIIAERSEKLGFDIDRACKIAVEASEQCGRGDIPKIREPITLQTAILEYKDSIKLFYTNESGNIKKDLPKEFGVFVGPEGGWTEAELNIFTNSNTESLKIGNFTLRAETACITATAILNGLA